jgi:UDP-N-acetylglucosamine acyltransferase
MNNIHPTAVIGDSVKLGTNNSIGPYVIITGKVEIGDNNWIGPHTTIGGSAEIRNSELPQTWEIGEHQGVVTLGSNNVIRDACVIHAGYYTGTRILDHCYIMNQTYVAHDCTIASHATLSSNVALGGHVYIQDGANLGMGTIVHQRRIVGSYAIVGMGSIVTRDVMPFAKAFGNPCRIHGLNEIGMQRNGFLDEEIKQTAEFLKKSNSANLSPRLAAVFQKFLQVSDSSSNDS